MRFLRKRLIKQDKAFTLTIILSIILLLGDHLMHKASHAMGRKVRHYNTALKVETLNYQEMSYDQMEEAYNELVQYVLKDDGIHLIINDQCQFEQAVQIPYTRSFAEKNLDHICLRADIGSGVSVHYPENSKASKWLSEYNQPLIVICKLFYIYTDESGTNHVSRNRRRPNEQRFRDLNHEMTQKARAAQTLLMVANYGSSFQRSRQIQLAENQRLLDFENWIDDHQYKYWTPLAFALLLVFIKLRSLSLEMKLRNLIRETEIKLSDEQFQEVLTELTKVYILKGFHESFENEMKLKLKNYLRTNRTKERQKRNLERRQRHKRELAKSSHSQSQAKSLSKRELRKLRRKQSEDQQTLLIEDDGEDEDEDFTQSEIAFIEELDRKIPTKEEEEYNPHLEKILAASHDLAGIEEMPKEDQELFAKHIRLMKRKIKRPAWNSFVTTFDGSKRESYQEILELVRRKRWDAINEMLIDREIPEYQSGEWTIDDHPQLLLGKKILLVGGDPRLKDYYIENLELLGAKCVEHFASAEDMKRLQNASGDIGMVFYERTSHGMQKILNSRVSNTRPCYLKQHRKSNFLQGAIEDIRKWKH